MCCSSTTSRYWEGDANDGFYSNNDFNIAVNILGKGEKLKSALIVERILRCAALVGAVVQFGSA
jgi:hypothetical protein